MAVGGHEPGSQQVTTGVVSADVVRDLTAAVWRHVVDGSPGPLSGSPDLSGIIGRCSADRQPELWGFAEHVGTLEGARQREFVASIDEIQIESKLWLVDRLRDRCDLGADSTVLVLGGWFGILPLLLNWRLAVPPARMICVDINVDACALGRRVPGSLYDNVEYQVADALALDYTALGADPRSVLVNTICEHLVDAGAWWARVGAGQLSVLQSNNYEQCPDHVNCVKNLEEMKAQTPITDMWFEGVLPLSLFDRFMLIGRK